MNRSDPPATGYVTDTVYPVGYHREQSPAHMRLACLLNGVGGFRDGGSLTCIELGCAHGFAAMALAASNPDWRVIGIDLMPSHLDGARALAAAAGIGNVEFVQADLSTLAEAPAGRDLPEADMVSLHGFLSWVSPEVRAGAVRLMAQKLRPGGLVQASYNGMPGWQSGLGMRRLIHETGLRSAGDSIGQATAGLGAVIEMLGAGAMHLTQQPFVHAMLHSLRKSSVNYLAHEYMNGTWSAFFHAEIADLLAPAGLVWAGSANVMENLPDLALTPAQQAAYAAAPDPLMAELLKDLCLFRGFRNDVFVRGGHGLDPGARAAALGGMTLAAAAPAGTFPETLFIPRPNVPRLPIELPGPVYAPVLAALAAGPRRIDELLALGGRAGLCEDDPAGELAAVLVGSNHAVPVSAAPLPPTDAARRFNQLAAERLAAAGDFAAGIALATGGTGAPLPCTALQAFVCTRLGMGMEADAILAALPEGQWAAAEESLRNDPQVWMALGLM